MPSRLTSALAAALALAVAGFAPIPPPKPKKAAFTLADLEGTWEVVRHEIGHATRGGGALTESYQTVYIQRGTWMAKRVFRDGSDLRSVTYTLSLDATKSPAVFDLTFNLEKDGGYTRKGVA